MKSALRRYSITGIGALAVALFAASGGFSAQEPACPVPERFYAFEPALTKTGKALADGREIVIATLGGASTLGLAAGNRDLNWPARLGSVLAARFPSARPPKVVNLGVTRQTAKRAAERLRREVLPLKPTLVIWETGTMEAVHGTPSDEFRNTVQSGIEELRAAGVEVVLMNMQFSRDTEAIIDFEPYLVAMRELADANDLPLFRRHEIMRYWAESGTLSLRAADDDKRRQVAARLYDCIGRAVAEFVTRGVPAMKPADGAVGR